MWSKTRPLSFVLPSAGPSVSSLRAKSCVNCAAVLADRGFFGGYGRGLTHDGLRRYNSREDHVVGAAIGLAMSAQARSAARRTRDQLIRITYVEPVSPAHQRSWSG